MPRYKIVTGGISHIIYESPHTGNDPIYYKNVNGHDFWIKEVPEEKPIGELSEFKESFLEHVKELDKEFTKSTSRQCHLEFRMNFTNIEEVKQWCDNYDTRKAK